MRPPHDNFLALLESNRGYERSEILLIIQMSTGNPNLNTYQCQKTLGFLLASKILIKKEENGKYYLCKNPHDIKDTGNQGFSKADLLEWHKDYNFSFSKEELLNIFQEDRWYDQLEVLTSMDWSFTVSQIHKLFAYLDKFVDEMFLCKKEENDNCYYRKNWG